MNYSVKLFVLSDFHSMHSFIAKREMPGTNVRRRTPKFIRFHTAAIGSTAAEILIMKYKTQIRVAICAECSKPDSADE
jgi:hypothetical protein